MLTTSDFRLLWRRSLVKIWVFGLVACIGAASSASPLYMAVATDSLDPIAAQPWPLALFSASMAAITAVVVRALRDFASRKGIRSSLPAHKHPELNERMDGYENRMDRLETAIENIRRSVDEDNRAWLAGQQLLWAALQQNRAEVEGLRKDVQLGQENSLRRSEVQAAEIKALRVAQEHSTEIAELTAKDIAEKLNILVRALGTAAEVGASTMSALQGEGRPGDAPGELPIDPTLPPPVPLPGGTPIK